jgi:hypothetical protein
MDIIYNIIIWHSNPKRVGGRTAAALATLLLKEEDQ